MIKKSFRLPIYDQFKVTVIVQDNIEEIVSKVTKTECDGKFKGVFLSKNNGTNIILGFESKEYTPGVIAHECFHATAYILDFVGVSLTEESEEAYTYLLQYLVDAVYKVIENNSK